MAAKKTQKAAEVKVNTDAPTKDSANEMTNVRHSAEVETLLAALKALAQSETDQSFEIGDLVETATTDHKMKVEELVTEVGLSRQRLCECRSTAIVFRGDSRRKNVPFHFYTLAARAAKKFAMEPEKALEMVTAEGFQSTRKASTYFGSMRRQKENGESLQNAGLLVAKHDDLLDHCHHDDFRNVVVRLAADSVNLVIADPAYDGKRKSTTSATARVIDGNTEEETQAAIESLLTLFADKMADGGTLALFRPGAAIDPAWLFNAIESNRWKCDWALTWNKQKTKLGRLNAPYGIASERLLILSRRGQKLVGHDDSARDDVLEFMPIQPHYADSDPRHQHEKPLDLMKHLISKHTYEGGLVVEPFGGTGPACQAAIAINRHWLYCETAKENLDIATARIAATAEGEKKTAG